MSERHADRLFQRLLEGGEPSEADRLHLVDCDACRQAVAEVDRLDQRLEAAAATLVTEPLPPGVIDEPAQASAPRRWQLAIGVAAVAVIATLSLGPVANLLVADASPTPSASVTQTALPTITPSAQPSGTPEPLPGLVAGPDLCGNGARGFEIWVPVGWYANAGGGLEPACTRLAHEPFNFAVPVDVPVQLFAVTGTFEDAMAVVDRKETPASDSVVLANYPALRLEYAAVPGAADQQLAYVVSADDAALEPGGQGRYLVAMTTDGATYERDAAALDEMLSRLFFFEPMVEDPAIAASADALMADADSCQSPDGTYTISFPASWHAADDGRCAAFASGPLPGPFGDYAGDEMYPDAQITLGISEGTFGSIEPALSLDRFWLAGRPAMRLELHGGVLSPGEIRAYDYVIGLGPTFDAGPNFVASTSSSRSGDYRLNKAILDRMMASLSLSQGRADLVRVTDPDLTNGGPGVVAFDGNTLVGGGLECVGSLGTCRSMLYTSTDMVDWSRLDALPDPPDVAVDAIAVGDRGWVAFAGTDGWFSRDGLHWEANDTSTLKDGLSDGGPAYQFEGPCCVATVDAVVATDDGFVAVGGVECYKCAGRAAVWRSADGRRWSRLPYESDFEGGPMTGLVELPNGRLVAVGAAAWTSDDGGQTWQRHDAAFAGAAASAGLALGSDGLVAAGGEFETLQGIVWTSTDGETWRRLEPAGLEGVTVTAVGWHDGRIVLAGEVQTDDTLVVDSVTPDGTVTSLTVAPDSLGRISRFEEFDGRLLGLGTSVWVSP